MTVRPEDVGDVLEQRAHRSRVLAVAEIVRHPHPQRHHRHGAATGVGPPSELGVQHTEQPGDTLVRGP